MTGRDGLVAMQYDPDPVAIPFRYDDGGRAAAGFSVANDARDCVARAIAIAAELPYRQVYDELARRHSRIPHGRKSARDGVPMRAYKPYIERELGWSWTPTMKIGSGCAMHLRPEELPAGRIIVRLSKHLAAVIDGVIHDTHDPSRDGTRCVYGVWQAPGAEPFEVDVACAPCGCPWWHIRDLGHQEGCDA